MDFKRKIAKILCFINRTVKSSLVDDLGGLTLSNVGVECWTSS